LKTATGAFPAVILTGPRRAGKTALFRKLFPKASYHLLEAPDVVARIRSDPRGWLDSIRTPAILDEVQNAPELFAWVRARIDASPRKRGQWLITGSQDFSLMQGVTESMAGRAAVMTLLPLSCSELGQVDLLRGGYPEVWARPSAAGLWFDSYLQTFLERDVRALRAVHDLSLFRRFLALLASRHGQVLNRSDLAAPLGLSVPTVNAWLSVLETTGQIVLVQPYFENFGKRLIKSPRLYWLDSGMACHLLGLTTQRQLESSPFMGPVFEGAVAAEFLKAQVNAGHRRELYFFRDERGLEVDFLLPRPGGRLALVEVKSSMTAVPQDAKPMERLGAPANAERWVVYRGKERVTLAPGVKAVPVEEASVIASSRQ
jgi:uncharacterized protein